MRLTRDDRGSITAEFALALPAVLLLLALALGTARVVLSQVQCADAARAGARAAARGEAPDVVRAAGAAVAPDGAAVTVTRAAGVVVVEVGAVQRLAGPLGGSVRTGARAVAAVEG
ncbi:Flp pilus assembly protein TadG [Kineococcus radiotolerans]|uniref:Flp pilus assembly protein TadG n=1 Tax=Kineococcus radiotolerans TaxID=131568 RepID=A0A7W4XX75_KINRA|nr:TadE family type IV pilus minor pilin [Kineococcus radiotolerans]MBB2900885.1 Flp pilus assembly protein TadG [Kineococcus radiotolerans]